VVVVVVKALVPSGGRVAEKQSMMNISVTKTA
jgi:hypothetical protein